MGVPGLLPRMCAELAGWLAGCCCCWCAASVCAFRMNSGCDHEAGACAGRELPGAPMLPGMAGMRVTTAGPVGAEPAICMGAEVLMVMGMLRLGLLVTGAADAGAAGGRCSPGLLGTGGGRPAASF